MENCRRTAEILRGPLRGLAVRFFGSFGICFLFAGKAGDDLRLRALQRFQACEQVQAKRVRLVSQRRFDLGVNIAKAEFDGHAVRIGIH